MKARIFADPITAGVVAAILSVGLGLAYLQLAGAPFQMLAMNTAALTIGMVTVVLVRLAGYLPGQVRAASPLLGGIALLTTAAFGQPIEGAARWLTVGGVTIQTSLILLPAMLVLFARERTRASAGGMALAMVAMALQPDRAMAAMAVVGVGLTLVVAPDRGRYLWLAPIGIATFTAAVARPDRLPAAPFVDQILYTAPGLSEFAGLAVLGGSALLISPALLAITRQNRLPLLVFGAVWATAVGAAALGNYPTPLVGYGGSAILGYCLSVAVLRRWRLPAPAHSHRAATSERRPPEGLAFEGGLSG